MYLYCFVHFLSLSWASFCVWIYSNKFCIPHKLQFQYKTDPNCLRRTPWLMQPSGLVPSYSVNIVILPRWRLTRFITLCWTNVTLYLGYFYNQAMHMELVMTSRFHGLSYLFNNKFISWHRRSITPFVVFSLIQS